MARGVNKVILVGGIGADPDTRYMPSGGAVTEISIATTEAWTDKSSGQKQEETTWHKVVFFNRSAEVVAEFCRKGSQIYVEGKIKHEKWTDKETGADKYSTEVVLQGFGGSLTMLDGPNGGGSGGGGGGGNYGGGGGGGSYGGDPMGGGYDSGPSGGGSGGGGGQPSPSSDIDDEIPF